MAEDLKRMKDVRAAYRGHCTRNVEEAEKLMKTSMPDLNKLKDILEAVSIRREKISFTDDKIENLVDSEDIDTEVQEALEYSDKLRSFENKVKRFLEERLGDEKDVRYDESVPSGPPTSHNMVRLPKMVLKEFTGDPLDWVSFWDSFEAAMHMHPRISDVEKMTYLKSYLKGDAARAIEGLSLTKCNYNIAVSLLKERFGKKQIIQNAYMQAILQPKTTLRN